MARSQSCKDAGLSNCTNKPSHSPVSQKMTHEKRERKSTERKPVGGAESRSIKVKHGDERGRSRSKSPRRNSWREEIKQIKSWKDERENREIKFEDIRHDRKDWSRGRVAQRSSKCFKKVLNSVKKFDLLLPSRKFSKKEARLLKETSVSCRVEQRGRERRGGLIPPLVFQRRGERLSRWKQVKKSSNIVKDVEVGLVTRRIDERESLEQLQPPDMCCVDRAAMGSSSKDSADISDDELELRISDKDIFPELRDEQDDRESAVPDVDRDDLKAKANVENCEGIKIQMKQLEDKEESSQRSVKLVDDNDKDLEDEKKAVPVRRAPEFGHGSGTVLIGSSKNEDSSSSTIPVPSLSDEGSSAMARNFSLLELKMEVYTTRLKELEWEREQLRKEREVFQDKEVSAKRDLVKSLLEKEEMSVDFNLCEKEDKENKG